MEVIYHIADDGSPSGYIEALQAANSVLKGCTTTNSAQRGYGANYNLALQVVHNIPDVEWVLPLEDDWELIRPLNIGPMLELLSGDGNRETAVEPATLFNVPVGCIRMGYVGYTQELSGTFIKLKDYHYLLLNSKCPEPHVFAGHPRLESVGWEKYVGPWPEGLSPGETEWEVAHKENARKFVVWPIDLIKPTGDAFVHIGTDRSY